MAIGRPSDYTDEKAAEICDLIASGKALSSICKAEGMPGVTTVFRWLDAHEQFRKDYARAREAQADFLAEETLEIADDSAKDFTGEGFNSEHVQRSRLRVDTRKWWASKVAPKKYGERLDHNVGGNVGLTVNIVRHGSDKPAE